MMHSSYPMLNLPQCDLVTRPGKSRTEVFDICRRRWVSLTPEEWVRQHALHFLCRTLDYPLQLLQVEGAITVGTLTKRCDIVAYNSQHQPVLIVECKQPAVHINQKVIDQACRYNQTLHVPYLFLTNGMTHLCLHVDYVLHQLYRLQHLPLWSQL